MFSPLLALNFVSVMLGWALFFVSLFLILLILVQRGRGGGLTGALGGPGGQSAFGSKAGDLFTKITSFVALGWIALCVFTMLMIGDRKTTVAVDPTPAVSPSPAEQRGSSDSSGLIDFGDEDTADSESETADQPAADASGIELNPATDDAAPATEQADDAAATPGEAAATDAPGDETQPQN